MDIHLTRRQALIYSLLCAGSLAGCSTLSPRPLRPLCPGSPAINFPDGPLTVDAHCHVFNGTDLQISDFLSKVAVRQDGPLALGAKALGELLHSLSWAFAPSGQQELGKLAEVERFLLNCSTDSARAELNRMQDEAYRLGISSLRQGLERSALRQKVQFKRFSNDAETETQRKAIELIDQLPESANLYQQKATEQRLLSMSSEDKAATGMIAFVLQNFQYRYVSVFDYLHTYNEPGKRVVDLMLPSMVDYDWWLAKGHGTTTSLKDQVQVMKRISILTGGRVHGFVPFDPLRQVAYDLRQAPEDSLGLVRDAIQLHGCVGVKLYPPMGFAALGNSGLSAGSKGSFWSRSWLPAFMSQPDIGQRLDDAMRKLFTWCQDHEVPVMAHTNRSNGPSDDFEALAGARYWKKALVEFPRLRVSFGHFGGAGGNTNMKEALAFTELMTATPGGVGVHAYADAGYFVEVLSDEPALRDRLKQLYETTANKGNAALANRFMYGTDWEMTLAEGKINTYLSQFSELFSELEAGPAIKQVGLERLEARFFGENAIDWIGLRQTERARNRLEVFYRDNGVTLPDWARKVDRGSV
ncbi:amidohydrolase family protein [Pseudomonas chlororaphis]|uniref:amidohydrolase family protein n=1 Tax=Pseudomonas chlororaphis TaxID=587753 RepID=UPI00240798F7|nr:amidohydrolase family protein [Pseudomonas chlororaphis]